MKTATLSGPMLPPKSGGPARQAMVLLHGYGADGRDLISLGYEWREQYEDMLFVSPNAPEACAQNPGGFQWFPLDVDRIGSRIVGVETARPVVVNFLMDLWAQTGLTAAETVLCGFSQGAMMALHVGTSLDRPLAGIIAFSGAFTPAAGFAEGRFARPPVALIHGELDQVVPVELSREAQAALTAAGFDARLHISPAMGHGISRDGLDFAAAFLSSVMAAKS